MEFDSSWNFVDKVIYINLEEAIERRTHMEKILKVIPPNKIIRFNAIKHEKGAIGCSKSHIECLRLAIKNNWNNILIMEDDSTWNNYEQSIQVLNKLVIQEYDVILLGGCFANFNKNTYKLFCGQTATSYLVSKHYYEKLLNNFVEGLDGFIKTNDYSRYALDQYWKKLQNTDNWYIVNPALVIQRPCHSYIENKNVNYTQWFNV